MHCGGGGGKSGKRAPRPRARAAGLKLRRSIPASSFSGRAKKSRKSLKVVRVGFSVALADLEQQLVHQTGHHAAHDWTSPVDL